MEGLEGSEALTDEFRDRGRGFNVLSVIVSGIQHALDLTARLVLGRGDPVWVEDPCHPKVPSMFKLLGSRIVPVPVDEHGVAVEKGLTGRGGT